MNERKHGIADEGWGSAERKLFKFEYSHPNTGSCAKDGKTWTDTFSGVDADEAGIDAEADENRTCGSCGAYCTVNVK